MDQQEMMKMIMKIQADATLTDAEKAIKRQELMSGKWKAKATEGGAKDGGSAGPSSSRPAENGSSLLGDDTLKCAICFDLCVRPVTAPCQHNFCLKCLQDLVAKAKNKACPSCRGKLNDKFIANPRINTALTAAIRAFKAGVKPAGNKSASRINNDDRPDEAYVTERAQRSGRANASSGRIMVTVPNDHFGPIPPEADPRGQGVLVGEWWKDRLDCRQWGAHFPHVAGIAGQSNVGSQSVVLSGGYEDDRDEGEWFLYTGSGGRDLSGNKRTNKVQSFDQVFESMNKALKLSCVKGLPVRVVRSFKEKRSAYAPPVENPVRYDGVYRIARCWRKKGVQGHLMCRYLFVRCDNEPAPWSTEDTGDKPLDLEKDLPAEAAEEMRQANKGEIFSMAANPFWDWDEGTQKWGWTRTAPQSQRSGATASGSGVSRPRKSEHERALLKMTCGLCKSVLRQPVSAPCGHAFCKPCLDKKFGGQAFEVDAGAATGRSLRIRKVAMPCPCTGCKADLADFLRTAQVNRDMEALIGKLQREVEAAKKAEEEAAAAAEGPAEEPTQEGALAEADREEDEVEEGVAVQSPTPPELAAVAAAAGPAVGIGAGAAAYEADQQAAVAVALCGSFPEFDASLVEALLEQEEGDVRAVEIALTRMRNQMAAEEKKKAKASKQAKATAAAEDEKVGTADGSAGKRGKKEAAAEKPKKRAKAGK